MPQWCSTAGAFEAILSCSSDRVKCDRLEVRGRQPCASPLSRGSVRVDGHGGIGSSRPAELGSHLRGPGRCPGGSRARSLDAARQVAGRPRFPPSAPSRDAATSTRRARSQSDFAARLQRLTGPERGHIVARPYTGGTRSEEALRLTQVDGSGRHGRRGCISAHGPCAEVGTWGASSVLTRFATGGTREEESRGSHPRQTAAVFASYSSFNREGGLTGA